MNRKECFENIKNNPDISVLIIGAGINGIGTYRDLVLQGVDVLLIDKGDFCCGASAASSHMVHGGIRYLENGEFRLVREAVRERNNLLVNAPHNVKPLATTFPIFKLFSGLFNAPLKFIGLLNKPAERGAIVIKIGMMVYDAYTHQQGTVPPHRFTGRKTSLDEFPLVNPDILCMGTYFDGAMPSPERISVELVLDAEEDAINSGVRAMAVNYVHLAEAQKDKIKLQDDVSGESFWVKPKLVINATGPWIDGTNALLGIKTKMIGGTKGSHVVLDHPELRKAIGDNEFFFENIDGRIVLIFPFEDKVLVGTSDLAIEDPDKAVCSDDEVDYFIMMIKKVFPTIIVNKEHIVYRFSGVRPLPTSKSNLTGQISRDHSVEILEPDGETAYPIFCLVGGKWTTFRAFSEVVTNKALHFLGIDRQKSTEHLPIGGGKNYPQSSDERAHWLARVNNASGVSISRLNVLFDRYGSRAELIAGYISSGDDKPLVYLPDYSDREISYIVQNEKVSHLDDFLFRRSLLAMLGKINLDSLKEICAIVSSTLNWSVIETKTEMERVLNLLSKEHSVILK